MMDRDDPTRFYDPEKARFPRDRSLQLLAPLNYYVERYGFGVRIVVVDRAHENTDTPGTSAVEYHIRWAETVDTNTDAGKRAGYTRAILLAPAIPAAGREGAPSSAIFDDPKYVEGYFFCTPVAADGTQGDFVGPVRITSGAGGTVPADVEHFRCSESGEQDGQGTLSKISYAFEVPDNVENVDKFQFYFKNYPTLNQTSEGEAIARTSGAGGSQTGDIRLPVARRVGVGAITALGSAISGVGTNFLAMAAPGDFLEAFGVRAEILSVTDATTMTLTGAWSGPTLSGLEDWLIIGSVTIYCVSVGYDGSRRDDTENAPSATVLLDGELSTPNAPSLNAFAIPGSIRLEVTPSSGTQIAQIRIWRGTGSGVSEFSTSIVHVIKADQINGSTPIQWDDSDFTVNEKEDGQTFTYYATAVNVRDQESDYSAAAEANCRLVAGQDVDPSLIGRAGLKQMLYNSFISGTSGNNVDGADTSQDVHFDTTVGVDAPGSPYGGGGAAGFGRFRGYTRWHSSATGAAARATHQNGNEVLMPAPGVGNDCYLFQDLDAWDTNRATPTRFCKMKYGGVYVFSVYLKRSGGVPNGTFRLVVEQNNNGAFLGNALLRYRDGSGVLQSVASTYNIDTTILATTWTRFYGVYTLDTTLSPTREVRFTFTHSDSTAGDIVVCQPMLNEGEELGLWIADMGDVRVSQPTPADPPGDVGDGPGTRKGYIEQP